MIRTGPGAYEKSCDSGTLMGSGGVLVVTLSALAGMRSANASPCASLYWWC
jgi:hypothetical protein